MNKKYSIGNGILWAAAILAATLFHAPADLTIVVLPALAVGSLVLGENLPEQRHCRKTR